MDPRAALLAQIAKLTTAINHAAREQSRHQDGSDLWRSHNGHRNTLEGIRDGLRGIVADLE